MANAAPLALNQRVRRQPRTRHPVGMPDSDRAAIDVVTRGIDPEPIPAVEGLNGKGLVELPQPDIVDFEPVLLQKLWHGEDRANPHLVRSATGHCDSAIGAERRQSATRSFPRL